MKIDVGYEHIEEHIRHALISALETRWERYRSEDRRIGYGDDFAGNAWRNIDTGEITYTAVGKGPPTVVIGTETRRPPGA